MWNLIFRLSLRRIMSLPTVLDNDIWDSNYYSQMDSLKCIICGVYKSMNMVEVRGKNKRLNQGPNNNVKLAEGKTMITISQQRGPRLGTHGPDTAQPFGSTNFAFIYMTVPILNDDEN
jgi:hypothetical protein